MNRNISISDFARATRETFNLSQAARFVDIDTSEIVRLSQVPHPLRSFRNSLRPLPAGLVIVLGISKLEEDGFYDIELNVESKKVVSELDIIVGGWRDGVIVPSEVFEENNYSVDDTLDELITCHGGIQHIDQRLRGILAGIFQAVDEVAIQTIRDRV